MKTTRIKSVFIMVLAFTVGCSKGDGESPKKEEVQRATQAEFTALRSASLESKVQDFGFDAGTTGVFTTEKGMQIVINGACLTKNGSAVTGTVDVQVVELFERGGMLSTHKPTMGNMPNGDKALLISGGEFFIKATHQGDELTLDCAVQAYLPANLTGGGNDQMTLWKGNGIDNDCDGIDDDCDGFVWEEIEDPNEGQVGLVDGDTGEIYVASFLSFGWTNVDRFYSDPSPKTTLLVDVPEGFDDTNSSVFIAYNDKPNALGNLDTYIESSGLFSEHYGQIPIGLECHIIFVSEDNGSWLYALKQVTIADGATITILDTDLQTGTLSELEAVINGLP